MTFLGFNYDFFRVAMRIPNRHIVDTVEPFYDIMDMS